MKNYQNGKIYKITSPQSDKYYIGSTQSTLDERFGTHLSHYKSGERFCTSIQLLQYDDCKIELIENYPCDNVNELRRREGIIQLENIDMIVNKRIAGRTDAEYRDSHKEEIKKTNKEYADLHKDEIKKYIKEYADLHKDEIKKYNKEYRDLNKDETKKYKDSHKDELKKYSKEYADLNKEEIKKKRDLKKDERKKYNKEYRDLYKDEINKKLREKRALQKIEIEQNTLIHK